MYHTTKESRMRRTETSVTSPNVRARVMEKEELSGLNDRLATYIDRMRHLEQQNSKLTTEIRSCRESASTETGNVKALYEGELNNARKLIDDFAKERTVMELENQKTLALLDDLRQKQDKETKARIRAEDELKRTERRLHEKESLLIIVSKERKQLDERVKEQETELKKLQDDLDKQKKSLENEIIKRLSAENRAQTLGEEANFDKQAHKRELDEVRSSAESYRFTLETTDGPGDYGLIREKLKELRDEFEEEAEQARSELEDAYKAKFEEMRRSNNRERDQMTRLIEKNTEIKTELDTLVSDYNMLEAKNLQLQKRLNELEEFRLEDKEDFKKQMKNGDDRIRVLEDDLLKAEKEYESLLGIKIQLDVEIAAYRKMMEGEEERLNISPNGRSSHSGQKRSREEGNYAMEIENATTGSIEVEECDPTGRFIRIKNNSDDEALGGWCVQRIIDGKEHDIIEYRFTPKFVLKGQKTVTIWSQSSGMKHKAPTDMVLKNSDWKTGRSMVTVVKDVDENVVGKQTMKVVGPSPSRRLRRERNPESCHVM